MSSELVRRPAPSGAGLLDLLEHEAKLILMKQAAARANAEIVAAAAVYDTAQRFANDRTVQRLRDAYLGRRR